MENELRELAKYAKPTKRLNLRVLKLPLDPAWRGPFTAEGIEEAVPVV